MNTDRKIMIDDYFDSLLDDDQKIIFEEYLNNSEEVSELYNKLVALSQKYKFVADDISPTKDILEDIQTSLIDFSEIEKQKILRLKEISEEVKQSKPFIGKRIKSNKQFDYNKRYAFIPVVLIFIVFIFIGISNLFSSNTPWKISDFNGLVFVNGKNSILDIQKGDIVLTDKESMAKLKVPDTGEIVLESNSGLMLLEGNNDKNIIRFDEGKIDVYTVVPFPNLVIRAGNTDIIDHTAKYSVERNSREIKISVFQGNVEIKSASNFFLTDNYQCIISKGKNGLPTRIDVSPQYQALANFPAQNGNLDSLLSLSTEKDWLTLFHLIKFGDKKNREQIFNRLNELFPLPEGILKTQILNLEKGALENWFNNISWQI